MRSRHRHLFALASDVTLLPFALRLASSASIAQDHIPLFPRAHAPLPPPTHGVGSLAILAVEHHAVLLGRQIGEGRAHDRRQDGLGAGEAIVDRRAELEAGADAGEIRNRLIRAGRRQVLRA